MKFFWIFYSGIIFLSFQQASCKREITVEDLASSDTSFILIRNNVERSFSELDSSLKVIAKREIDSVHVYKHFNFLTSTSEKIDWIYDTTFKSQKTFLGITIIFGNDSLKDIFRITANSATVDSKTKIINLKNNVKICMGLEGNLSTEQITWNLMKHQFLTDSWITITTSNGILDGKGFESDEIFSKYEIKAIIGTHFFLNDESPK